MEALRYNKDGIARSALVRVRTGRNTCRSIARPVQKLVLLDDPAGRDNVPIDDAVRAAVAGQPAETTEAPGEDPTHSASYECPFPIAIPIFLNLENNSKRVLNFVLEG